MRCVRLRLERDGGGGFFDATPTDVEARVDEEEPRVRCCEDEEDEEDASPGCFTSKCLRMLPALLKSCVHSGWIQSTLFARTTGGERFWCTCCCCSWCTWCTCCCCSWCTCCCCSWCTCCCFWCTSVTLLECESGSSLSIASPAKNADAGPAT